MCERGFHFTSVSESISAVYTLEVNVNYGAVSNTMMLSDDMISTSCNGLSLVGRLSCVLFHSPLDHLVGSVSYSSLEESTT